IYTLVCKFPFDVFIPINSRILWIETLDLENAPYHSIRSDDNLFGTGLAVSADMGFYDDVFTHGVYEYYDDLNESLMGKIIIPKRTNSIDIPEGKTSLSCADSYSCYDTFAAHIDVGEKVTWKNQDLKNHTVTSGTPDNGPDGFFDSDIMGTYVYFSHTFDEPGKYDYYCTFHPWMQGKIIVGEM
ncbi:MAG: plastocyanin/azurin family copper-binding protein, partial [Candidatus Poribacteria bacterium]|nr:plastocyanin/azurin family copper-binding protein [Candidatus Poribacteria bacterium]